MTDMVTIQTSARLHMGFFDLHGGLGRKFGSIGLSLTEPSLRMTARLADTPNVLGGAEVSPVTVSRVATLLQLLSEKLNLSTSAEIQIHQAMPEHSGLGSGTQLALSVGRALAELNQLDIRTEKIAELAGRGGRSGIGIAAFDAGGLLIDGGRAMGQLRGVPPLLARYDCPENWSVLLMFDEGQSGVHGEREKSAFKQLPVFSDALAAHLCRMVLMQSMPAIVERDLVAFGRSIQVLQQCIGDYFSPVQGGRYASQLVGEQLAYLDQSGVTCFGQSSWGPTGFAIVESRAVAEKYQSELAARFASPKLSWKICSPCNHGALSSLTNQINLDN